MKLIICIVVLFGAGVCLGQEKGKDDDSCHGPAYHRLKEEAAKQESQNEAREVMQAFVAGAGGKLFEAYLGEQTRAYQAQESEWKRCLEGKRKPSFLCEAVAEGSKEPCEGIASTEAKAACFQLAGVVASWRSGDASSCAAVEPEDAAKLCRFVVTGTFDCSTISEETAGRVCAAVAAARGSGSLTPHPSPLTPLSGEERDATLWMLAMVEGNPNRCEDLSVAEKAACVAAFSGKTADCPRDRTASETIDRDWTCRNVVVYEAVHPTLYGTEVVVALASAYRDAGVCRVEYRPPGRARQLVAEVSVTESGFWKEVRHMTSARGIGEVSASCTWQ